MRRTMMGLLLGLAVAIATGTTASAADGPPAGRGAGGPPWAREGGSSGPRPFMLFRIFDANDDDALSEDEVPAPVWSRLSAADADEDGAVTREELIAYFGARARQGRPEGGRPTK